MNETASWSPADGVLCSSYQPANHVYFQVANFLLFISYMAPSSLGGLIYLRVTLAGGLFFMALWGYAVLCALDTFLWSFICMWINVVHFLYLLWQQRPTKLEVEYEQLYRAVFEKMHVTRRQLLFLLSKSRGRHRVGYGEKMAEEGVNRLDTISLVLYGKFLVTQNGIPLHFVEQHEFIESPEWFVIGTNELSRVTVKALQDSCLLVWHRDVLRLKLMKNTFLQCVFDKLLGRDVVKKLLQVDEKLSLLRSYSSTKKTEAANLTNPHYINGTATAHSESSPRAERKQTNGLTGFGSLETIDEYSTRQCTRL